MGGVAICSLHLIARNNLLNSILVQFNLKSPYLTVIVFLFLGNIRVFPRLLIALTKIIELYAFLRRYASRERAAKHLMPKTYRARCRRPPQISLSSERIVAVSPLAAFGPSEIRIFVTGIGDVDDGFIYRE